MKKKILPACTLLCIASALHASGQNTLNAAGGSAVTGGTQHEWSVGEMALVNTFTTSSIIVTQGVLQTKLGNPVSVDDHSQALNIHVFPNPADRSVFVHYTSAASGGTITLLLSDISGRVLSEQQILLKAGENEGIVDLSTLAAATYALSVSAALADGTAKTQTYKIQKLQ